MLSFGLLQADTGASYEIQMEGEAAYDAYAVEVDGTEAEAPKDNGEVVNTGAWQHFIFFVLFVYSAFASAFMISN